MCSTQHNTEVRWSPCLCLLFLLTDDKHKQSQHSVQARTPSRQHDHPPHHPGPHSSSRCHQHSLLSQSFIILDLTSHLSPPVTGGQEQPRLGQDGRPLLNKPILDLCRDRWGGYQGSLVLRLCVGSTTRSTASTTTSCPGESPGTSSRTGTGSMGATSAGSAAWTSHPSRPPRSTDTSPRSCTEVGILTRHVSCV